MKVQIFATFDNKAKAYNQPFFMLNTDMAIRSFTDAVINPETQYHQNPLDYTLFHIGQYDDENAQIETQSVEMLITASQAQAAHTRRVEQLKTIQSIQTAKLNKENSNEE